MEKAFMLIPTCVFSIVIFQAFSFHKYVAGTYYISDTLANVERVKEERDVVPALMVLIILSKNKKASTL